MSEPLINLRIVRGPLEPHENEGILSEYNRLAPAQITMQDFLHWVQQGPAGPSCHAIFETDEGRIVGHSSLIPLRGRHSGNWLVPAKSEYGFIHEDFRVAKIRGFENMGSPRQIILLGELFRHCRSVGWGPFLISGSRPLQRFGPRAQCYRVGFPLWECLLILRPLGAALKTPNLGRAQKSLLGLAGLPQRIAWSLGASFSSDNAELLSIPIDNPSAPDVGGPLSFFEDEDSLRWRYPETQYERVAFDAKGEEFIIVKRGSPSTYLRVCQWKLQSSNRISFALAARLVQMALKQKALGVRWAVYGTDEPSEALARRLRRFGFLTARRVRTLLIQSKEEKFLRPESWNLNDAMFCFDF